MKRMLGAVAALLFTATAAFADAGSEPAPMTQVQAVQIVLTATPVPAQIFAQSFLAQVPASQIATIRDRVTQALGTFQSVQGANGQYIAHYTHGTLKVLIHLDAQGKIDGLLLREPVVTGATIEDAEKMFAGFAGSVGYVVTENGRDLAARNAGEKLGVGSSFKSAVLSALRREIASGARRWTDIARLQHSWKSLPSGVLQTWPDDAPLTLATLATEMISISDNTAADSLIHIVGQQALAPYAYGNTPFITTRQMFLLKTTKNAQLRERFRFGDAAARQAVLSEIDRERLPDVTDLDTSPSLSDIEWHFSNRELCSLMQGVRDLPLMSVNPGIASADQWKRIAYKGGSDWGVISMTTWLEAKDGTTFCVSATWNDRAAQVDETKFSAAYGALIGALATR